MTVQGTAGPTIRAADQAGNSEALEHLARLGLVAYGVVHLLVAWLAVHLAWFGGTSGGSADQSGAMRTLAESPVGKPLLWILAAGLIALAAWQAAEVLRWRLGWSAPGKARTTALRKSVHSVAKAVVYAALAVLAIRYATGTGQSSSQQQQQTTQGVFGWPGGRWIVALVGLALIGVGGYHVYKGWSKRFLEQIDLLEAPPRTVRLVTRLGRIGFPAKGVALALVGALFIYAAITFDPSKARGLDGALRTILSAPFGQILLTLVAAGIAAFGAFCFVRARYIERT
jgi:hypothetical protein